MARVGLAVLYALADLGDFLAVVEDDRGPPDSYLWQTLIGYDLKFRDGLMGCPVQFRRLEQTGIVKDISRTASARRYTRTVAARPRHEIAAAQSRKSRDGG